DDKLLAATSISRDLASFVAHAICGVIRQFFAFKSGLFAVGGSTDNTSSPAPAIVPVSSASAKSCSTIIGPREVFNRNAVFFIRLKFCLSIKPLVSGKRGQ